MKQRAGGGKLGRWCDCSSQTSVLPGERERERKGGWGVTSASVNVAVVVAVHLIGLHSAVLQQLDDQRAAGESEKQKVFAGWLQ